MNTLSCENDIILLLFMIECIHFSRNLTYGSPSIAFERTIQYNKPMDYTNTDHDTTRIEKKIACIYGNGQ